MRLLRLVICFTALFPVVYGQKDIVFRPTTQLAESSKRWAVLIGVDEYSDSNINRLHGAANDAKSLKRTLVRYGGFPDDQVIVLASGEPATREPTRANLLTRFANVLRLVPKDGLLVFAYSGHGIDRGGRAFLLPSDARLTDDISLLEETSISVNRVKSWIQERQIAQVLVLLDACRNDPGGRADAETRMSDAFRFDLRNSGVRAFATFYSADMGERAYESQEQRRGYFMWMLDRALSGEAANASGEVTLGGAIHFVQERVPKQVAIDLGGGRKQTPIYQLEGFKADELVLSVAGRAGKPGEVAKPGEIAGDEKRSPAPLEIRTNPKDGQRYVFLPAGKFTMGCSARDTACYDDEKPAHEVEITQGFWLGQTEVTVAAWKRYVAATGKAMPPEPKFGDRPLNANWSDNQQPIVNVSWTEAVGFCEWSGGRLPTEAEWEYAARAGSSGARYGDLEAVAWYRNNSNDQLHRVSGKKPNAWKLQDMLGNVWEWVSDWYGEKYYAQRESRDPQGPPSGEFRVLRGGCWINFPRVVRASHRYMGEPGYHDYVIGVRCRGEFSL